MNCLLIGYGSIGKCHLSVLRTLEKKVSIVTNQKINDEVCYGSVEAAFAKEVFDYIIIANATYLHYSTLLQLIDCGFQGIVLVEKPLFSKPERLPENKIADIFVAYNLRFHELLLETKKLLKDEKMITFSVYVGQYLPTWRTEIDYRNCYSAKSEEGGGVLRDLSHELDYALWLCGSTHKTAAMGGYLSNLEINSDDVCSVLMSCESCPVVNIQMNYLDRRKAREIIINTNNHTYFVDFINGFLSIDGVIVFRSAENNNHTYIRQHKAILNRQFQTLCTYAEGMSVMKLIDKIEKVSSKGLVA